MRKNASGDISGAEVNKTSLCKLYKFIAGIGNP
jgi:hypothetical protein